MQTKSSTDGIDIQILSTFADILELATSEPETMNEANERLWAICTARAPAILNVGAVEAVEL